MAVAHTTALNLIGKYVSFHVESKHSNLHYEGVVCSLTLQMDGSHSLGIGFDDHYALSEINGLKVLGEVTLYPNINT